MRLLQSLTLALGLAVLLPSATLAGEIYSGEPLGEALHDLSGAGATLVSHELASASPLLRTDVFRLADGRLLAVTSRASKLGDAFSIEALRVTPSADSKLTKRLPTQSLVQLPKKPKG